MATSDRRSRWISYTTGPGGKDHLTAEERAIVEQSEHRRGRLLCEVHVQVYEHDALPCVQFPAEAALNIESDRGEVAAAVARARESLASWR
jgi:hypothetical protein